MTPDFETAFERQTFGEIGLAIASMYRSISALRPLLSDDGRQVSPKLVDAAFLRAHVIAISGIIVQSHTDEEQDDLLIDDFVAKLREAVAFERLMR